MTTQTKSIIRAALASDPTITDENRKAVEIAMQGRDPFEELPRCIRYEQAAHLLGVSKSRIKQLVAENKLIPVRPEGTARAIGVTEKSLLALLHGRTE